MGSTCPSSDQTRPAKSPQPWELLRNLSDNGIVGTWTAKRSAFKLARRCGMPRDQAAQMWDGDPREVDPLDALLPGNMGESGLQQLRRKLAK